MAKKKKITKLMRSGRKRFPAKFRDDFPQEIVQKMDEIIQGILTNNRVLDEKELWLIKYIETFLEFRAATWEKKVKVIRKINKAVAVAVEKKYLNDEEDEEIGGINRALLKKEEEANFETFKKRLKERSKK